MEKVTKSRAADSPSGRLTKPRPRGRPRGGGAQLRSDILHAGERVYAEYGYAESTVAKIIAVANVSRPTFYKLFKDCHAVIDEVVAALNKELEQQIEAAIEESESLLAGINAAIDAYFDWCLTRGPVVARIYAEIGLSQSPAAQHRLAMVERLMEFLQREVARLNLAPLPAVFYDSLLRVVENCGSQSVWPERQPAQTIEVNKQVAKRIVMAAAKQASLSAETAAERTRRQKHKQYSTTPY